MLSNSKSNSIVTLLSTKKGKSQWRSLLVIVALTAALVSAITITINHTHAWTAQQLSEPTDVIGLTKSKMADDGSNLSLKWKANPAKENVDEYAIYGYYGDPSITDIPQVGVLLGRTKGLSFNVELTVGGDHLSAHPFSIVEGSGNGPYFWIVAHNAHGWGENLSSTRNPDGKWSSLKGKNATDGHVGPTFYTIDFPCTDHGRAVGACME